MSKSRSFMMLLGACLFGLSSVYGQNEFEAKQAIIDGVAAYRSGESGADSLFAQGESHPELGSLAAYNRGRSLMDQEEGLTEARKAFQRAIQDSGDSMMQADAWHNTGNSLLMEQDIDGAIESYKSALRAHPGHDAARYNLAYAMRMKEQEQEQEQEQDQEQDQDQEQEQEQEQEQDQEQDQDQDQDQDQEQEQEQESKDGEGQPEEQPAPPQQVEGQISPEDMERILESLEREEGDIQAKLRREKGKGQKSKIEKDW